MNQEHIDTLVGAGSAIGGATGLTIQAMTEYANLTVTILNIFVALGGLYLLYRRIRRDKRKPLDR